jgi:hypothetical protein
VEEKEVEKNLDENFASLLLGIDMDRNLYSERSDLVQLCDVSIWCAHLVCDVSLC